MNGLRADFPIFNKKIGDYPFIYLDSAATAQKPKPVLDAMYSFYANEYASIGRGIYPIAETATLRYEQARAKVAQFLGASANSIVFTGGATHGMNILADSWGASHLKAGDEIILAEWEHHSTLLPWQHVALQKGAHVRYIPVLPDGTLDESSFDQLFSAKTKLVVISQVSNVFGTLIPLAKLLERARAFNALFFLDAAQSAPHKLINIEQMKVDALVLSAHKMGGPTGVGALYIAPHLHDRMQPHQRGGGMVYEADFHKASWRAMPHKFEAGTPPFVQAIGFGAAIDYLNEHVDFNKLREHEAQLCKKLIDGLSLIARARVHGPQDQLKEKGHLVSFELQGVHAHDAAAFLGSKGICVRAGNLCAQPLAKKLNLPGLIRASFYLYNTPDEIDSFLNHLEELLRIF